MRVLSFKEEETDTPLAVGFQQASSNDKLELEGRGEEPFRCLSKTERGVVILVCQGKVCLETSAGPWLSVLVAALPALLPSYLDLLESSEHPGLRASQHSAD